MAPKAPRRAVGGARNRRDRKNQIPAMRGIPAMSAISATRCTRAQAPGTERLEPGDVCPRNRGMARSFTSALERGKKDIRLSTIKLCGILCLTIRQLFKNLD